MDPYGRMLLSSTSFARMTSLVIEATTELREGRLVMSQEGGYSPFHVPYCGLAVLETLGGHSADILDPFLDRYAGPFQELTAAQSEAINLARVASNLGSDEHVV